MRAFSLRLVSRHHHFRRPLSRPFGKVGVYLPPRRFSTAAVSSLYDFDDDDDDENGIPSSSTSLFGAAKNVVDNDDEDFKLAALEEEISKLNHGTPINVHSPKQVSAALFGNGKQQSTSKAILVAASKGNLLDEFTGQPLTAEQQRLAALILECRECRYRSSSNNSNDVEEEEMSTSTVQESQIKATQFDNERNSFANGQQTATKETTDTKRPQQPQRVLLNANDASHYEKIVDALFQHPKNLVHEYWKEVLKQVTRPSARALVAQLDPTDCPMGYNPLAVPRDPLRGASSTMMMTNNNDDEGETTSATTTTTTTAGKKGSFLRFCRDAKEKHPDCVIVTRCGDFYET